MSGLLITLNPYAAFSAAGPDSDGWAQDTFIVRPVDGRDAVRV